MTPLRHALRDYLRTRRQLGFYLERDEPLLERFVEFLEQAGAERITTELALRWARMPAGNHPSVWHRRLGIVRQFARYLATIDPDSEVPSKDLLPGHRPRIAPYIYSPHEIVALMSAARALEGPLRAASFETAIGLMATTGLRLREALGLDRADVDLSDGALHVRAGKRGRDREVVLHPSATDALERYARQRDSCFPGATTPAFFIITPDRRIAMQVFWGTFATLIEQTGLQGRGQRVRPRTHDLRHTFAVRTLLGFYRSEERVEPKLPLLSTYLGHVSPHSTYWYLESVPELLEFVAARLELPEGLS